MQNYRKKTEELYILEVCKAIKTTQKLSPEIIQEDLDLIKMDVKNKKHPDYKYVLYLLNLLEKKKISPEEVIILLRRLALALSIR